MKERDKFHSKMVKKSEKNVADGRKVSSAKLQARKKKRPNQQQPLPARIDTQVSRDLGRQLVYELNRHKSNNLFTFSCLQGQRRALHFTPEFLAMLKILFQEDIRKKHIRKKTIINVLKKNPAFQQLCHKMNLSVENVRNRIRIMINNCEVE